MLVCMSPYCLCFINHLGIIWYTLVLNHLQLWKEQNVLIALTTQFTPNRETKLFEIEWSKTQRRKFVKRLNLLLKDENASAFKNRILQAQQFRAKVQHLRRSWVRFIHEWFVFNTKSMTYRQLYDRTSCFVK